MHASRQYRAMTAMLGVVDGKSLPGRHSEVAVRHRAIDLHVGVGMADPRLPAGPGVAGGELEPLVADEKSCLHRQFHAIGRMAPASRRIIDPLLHGSLRRFRQPIAGLLIIGSFLSILARLRPRDAAAWDVAVGARHAAASAVGLEPPDPRAPAR